MKVFIIAEMGVNHNGDVDIAKELLRKARDAGADAVKTQSFYPGNLASRFAKKADYQLQTTSGDDGQLAMLSALQLTRDAFADLQAYAKETGIILFSTPFDMESLRDLDELDNPIFKIPSGEITNMPYLIGVARLRKPTILSTGMSTLKEVSQAVEVLTKHGCADLTLLHCNTQYPTPFEDANLLAICTLKQAFGLPVGFSDHTPGIEASLAAVALGAEVIEKHFTLSREMEGPDHKASLEPSELEALAAGVRNIEKALGDGKKRVTASERGNLHIVRKSIVAARDIRAGEIFTEENMTAKRPGDGISPMRYYEILGKRAQRDFLRDEMIEV